MSLLQRHCVLVLACRLYNIGFVTDAEKIHRKAVAAFTSAIGWRGYIRAITLPELWKVTNLVNSAHMPTKMTRINQCHLGAWC